jgi:hypothetical protein
VHALLREEGGFELVAVVGAVAVVAIVEIFGGRA